MASKLANEDPFPSSLPGPPPDQEVPQDEEFFGEGEQEYEASLIISTSAEATVPTLTQQLQERVKKPEPYDGTRNVQGFLTQAKVYLRLERIEGDADKILVVAGFLKGNALDWFKPTLRDYLENAEDDQETATKRIFESYPNFEQKLKDNFDNPDAEQKAA
ncbi:hypothetical protein DL768_004165 [Monosporascus sp. mg162]|nr:hypothetical protein DL768_004165 [Monosporascus sp. mg162]